MARPRTPLAKAFITGRTRRDPGRFRNRREPGNLQRIGPPSPHLDRDQRKAFEAFRREVPWLTEADRALVDIASRLRADMWAGKVNGLGLLRQCLSHMGATPADRSKIAMPPDDAADDPASAFIN